MYLALVYIGIVALCGYPLLVVVFVPLPEVFFAFQAHRLTVHVAVEPAN